MKLILLRCLVKQALTELAREMCLDLAMNIITRIVREDSVALSWKLVIYCFICSMVLNRLAMWQHLTYVLVRSSYKFNRVTSSCYTDKSMR